MRKPIKYTTVHDAIVDQYLKDGWELYGSPIFTESSGEIIQALAKYGDEEPTLPPASEEPIAHAVDRPVRLTVFASGAEELSVFLTPGREPIQFIRSSHTDRWEQQ